MMSALFGDFMQRRVVVSYRSFGQPILTIIKGQAVQEEGLLGLLDP
jgi:hypothetical protein